MNKFLMASLIILGTILVLMVVLDAVVLSLKKRKRLPANRIGRYFQQNLFKFNAFVFLLIFCIIWIIPLIVGVLGSFTSQYTFEYHPGQLIPEDGFTVDNYKHFFNYRNSASGERYPVERWMLNSFIVSASSTLLYLLFAGLSAYALVFMKFKFRNVLFTFMLFTMVIPGVATMTPQIANMANADIAGAGRSRRTVFNTAVLFGHSKGFDRIRPHGRRKRFQNFLKSRAPRRQIGVLRARSFLLYGQLERLTVAADNPRHVRPQPVDPAGRYSRAVAEQNGKHNRTKPRKRNVQRGSHNSAIYIHSKPHYRGRRGVRRQRLMSKAKA